MSHIPSAAMPHAQSHEAPTIAPAIKRDSLPWGALVAGGVLAIGGAVTAAWLLRGRGGERPDNQTPARRTGAKATTARKPRAKAKTTRARKTKAAAD